MAVGGVGLGLLVAALWGIADTIAGLAARRWPLLKVTLVSQAMGLLALLICGAVVAPFSHHALSTAMIVAGMGLGVLTGICAAVGYLVFYRALAIGPMAFISPLTSTSALCTLLLSLMILRQRLLPLQLGAIVLIILGVLLAVTDWHDLRLSWSLKRFGAGGIKYALAASVAFGCMDFGIGASAQFSGWYLPVFWTRAFSVTGLLLAAAWRRQRLSTPMVPTRLRLDIHGFLCGQYLQPAAADPTASWRTGAVFALCSLRQRLTQISFQTLARPRSLLGSWSSRILGCRPASALLKRSSNLVYLKRYTPPSAARRTGSILIASNLLRAESISNLHLRLLSTVSGYREGANFRQRVALFLRTGMAMAIIAGLAENVGALCYSFDTVMTTTGIAAVIASGYSLFVMALGLGIGHERLKGCQLGGISLFLSGILLLGLVG